jgi:putative peptidoglycan lipid II flippase
MRLMGIFIIPAAILFLFFGEVIAKVLYFGIPIDDANYLGLTLSAFALGLIPVSINLVLLRGLNAFENLKFQVVGNLIMNIISVVLSLIAAAFLEPRWVTVGLAAIFTVHYFIGAGISFLLIKKHGIQIPILSLTAFYLRLIFIFVLSVMPIWLFRYSIPGGNLIYLLLVLSTSAIIYLVLLKSLKIVEVTTLIKVIKGGRE